MNALISGGNLVDRLLEEQQSMSAVERFSQRHEGQRAPLQERYYRDLIPLSKPAAGQQYAFAVDMDRCTGCKACVSACHSLNGLEENETWRDVGALVGYHKGSAYQQTVTTACHHCVEPGCLEGCPVMAYDKDAETGIVRHLDDQCIGCQYCTMKCPYDVPKYSSRLGIVRKCDMCHDRLAAGEAPACVQACPHEAITIRLVDKEEISRVAQPGVKMLPGAHDSSYTKPATRFFSKRPVPADAEAADAHVLHKEHAHWPLIFMLVLTQMATGLFVALAVAAPSAEFSRIVFPTSLGAFFLLNGGLLAAVFHLGRPLGAWRFFLGLRTSWMSREILAFSVFAGVAFSSVGAAWFFPEFRWPVFGSAAIGLLAVFTSVMIYADTHRAYWRVDLSAGRFFGTVISLGAGGCSIASLLLDAPNVARASLVVAAVAQIAGFAWEMARYSDSLRDTDGTTHKSSLIISQLMPRLVPIRSLLMLGTTGCFVGALAGGNLLPAAVGLAGAVAGAVLERYTFFTAVVALRMPRGI